MGVRSEWSHQSGRGASSQQTVCSLTVWGAESCLLKGSCSGKQLYKAVQKTHVFIWRKCCAAFLKCCFFKEVIFLRLSIMVFQFIVNFATVPLYVLSASADLLGVGLEVELLREMIFDPWWLPARIECVIVIGSPDLIGASDGAGWVSG